VRVEDLKGQRFGRLTALFYSDNYKWICKCDCGKEKAIAGSSLKNGLTKSCGCYSLECSTKHGMNTSNKKHRFYRIWDAMKGRCTRRNTTASKNYIDRGITICDAWLDFCNFKSDMFESYMLHCEEHGEPDTTIERINNDVGYFIDNCKWATRKQQSRNRRCTKRYVVFGELLTIKEISEKYNLHRNTIEFRLKNNWSNVDLIRQLKCVKRGRVYVNS